MYIYYCVTDFCTRLILANKSPNIFIIINNLPDLKVGNTRHIMTLISSLDDCFLEKDSVSAAYKVGNKSHLCVKDKNTQLLTSLFEQC